MKFAACAVSTLALWAATVYAEGAPQPLDGMPGDPALGKVVFLDRERGHCLLCHQVRQLDAPFQGTIGPDLSDVGNRLTAAQIRARVVDPTRQNPHAVMPPYHRTHDLRQVAQAIAGQPILTAREIEHVVSFVVSLRDTR